MAESGPDVKALKCINKFEINETAYFNRIDVSFFAKLLFNASESDVIDLNKFRFVFLYIVDHLELEDVSNVLKLVGLEDGIDVHKKLQLMQEILENSKTQSLFQSSLELDKCAFVNNLDNMILNEDFFPLNLMNKQLK